jgi:hypothetical protein
MLTGCVTNNSQNAYLALCLFGLSLAELQLFTSLNWTRIPTELNTGFIWKSLYNLRTDHTENISASIVETCVLSHCIATVAALTIANPLLLRYPATTCQHSFFYCCVPLEVSIASTVTAWGKRHNIYEPI